MLDIVSLKNDVFTARFRAEHGRDLDSEDKVAAKIDQIRDELFNLSFEESGKDLMNKFRQNFQRLREFMTAVDKEVANMAVFNQKDDLTLDAEDGGKHSSASSVQQLKAILRNYEALTESQHHLLN